MWTLYIVSPHIVTDEARVMQMSTTRLGATIGPMEVEYTTQANNRAEAVA
jgi:hypothetical protein